jgi:hypothetical protein
MFIRHLRWEWAIEGVKCKAQCLLYSNSVISQMAEKHFTRLLILRHLVYDVNISTTLHLLHNSIFYNFIYHSKWVKKLKLDQIGSESLKFHVVNTSYTTLKVLALISLFSIVRQISPPWNTRDNQTCGFFSTSICILPKTNSEKTAYVTRYVYLTTEAH